MDEGFAALLLHPPDDIERAQPPHCAGRRFVQKFSDAMRCCTFAELRKEESIARLEVLLMALRKAGHLCEFLAVLQHLVAVVNAGRPQDATLYLTLLREGFADFAPALRADAAQWLLAQQFTHLRAALQRQLLLNELLEGLDEAQIVALLRTLAAQIRTSQALDGQLAFIIIIFHAQYYRQLDALLREVLARLRDSGVFRFLTLCHLLETE